MKARNGDGSITSRKTATKGTVWDVQLTIRDRRGLSHRLSKRGFKSEKAAILWRDAQKQKSKAGQMVKAPNLTVPQLCEAYLDSQQHLKQSGQSSYRSNLRRHIAPHLNIRVANLTGARFQEFTDLQYARAQAEGRRGSGVIHTSKALVSATLRWAASSDVELIGHNPLDGSRWRDPSTAAGRRPFTDSEERRLMEAADSRSRLLWTLLIETGCRRGEALALTYGDFDWDSGMLDIHAILAREKGGYRVEQRTKTRQGRKVPISEPLRAALAAHQGSDEVDAHKHVFEGRAGHPVSFALMGKWWTRDTTAGGLQGRVPHELRHTWATRALEAGVQPSVVAKVLGHTSIATTMAYYRFVSDDEMKAAVNLVSRRGR